MKSKATITGAALALVLIGTLVGCAESPGDGGSDTAEEPAEVEESETDWTEVEEFVPTLPDGMEAKDVYFLMLRDSEGYGELNLELTEQWQEPVLAEDGVIDLVFRYYGSSHVPRNLTAAYITDQEDSTDEKAILTCESDDGYKFVCHARFTVPGNPGGTYYGVLETEPAKTEHAGYGAKRLVGSITIEPFGSEGDICGEIEGEMKCNSLPKE